MCKYLKTRKGLSGGICKHPAKINICCWNNLNCQLVKNGKATKEEIYGN